MKTILNLNRIYLFIKIIEAGNISRAALILNEPKAKLSRNLALLEDEVGTQLVYRTTRQFKLTESGMIFYQSSREHIMALMEATQNTQKNMEKVAGTLKITAPDDIGSHIVARLVSEFATLYPQVHFELHYTNEVVDLTKYGIDLAFRVGKLRDSTFLQKKITTVELFLGASPKYLNKFGHPESLDDLQKHQTIGFSKATKGNWNFTHKSYKRSLKINHKIVVNNYLSVRDFVKEGLGIGFLPKFLCQKEIISGEIIHLLKPWSDEGAPLQVILPQQKKIPKTVRVFVDFAVKKCMEYF